MTDNKFTGEEIIKRLEQCVKHGNRNYDTDIALDLINRLQAENKRLGKEVDLVSIQFQDLQERYEEAQAEIERLKECPKCVYEYDGEVMEYCVQGACPNFKTVEQIKAEAYKEFADEFESRCIKGGIYPAFVKRQLENVKKEMVGENNE